ASFGHSTNTGGRGMNVAHPTTAAAPNLTYWHPGIECCDAVWEAAYSRFETPEEERRKFLQRYRKMKVDQWPRDRSIERTGFKSQLAAVGDIQFRRTC